MHPNVFLKTFWRMELRPQIFVAMSFSPSYKSRFNDVIEPAINEIEIRGVKLKALRVDSEKTGDSILTDIMDGIAHSQLVLADVSSVGRESVSGQPFRNANVMYEVGLALACRQPEEVLLIRDDHDKFLFDVSTIPHVTIDFTDVSKAKERLIEELRARLHSQKFVNDARITKAIQSLSVGELEVLNHFKRLTPYAVWGETGANGFAIPRLLDKQLITMCGEFEDGTPSYELTSFGRVVLQLVRAGFRKFRVEGRFDRKGRPIAAPNTARKTAKRDSTATDPESPLDSRPTDRP